MIQKTHICIGFLIAGFLPPSIVATPLKKQPISRLEQRLQALNGELDQLAHYGLRTGIGAVGYRSDDYIDANHVEWVQINLEKSHQIDQIVLVPSIWRDTKFGFRADGFPVQFQIIAGTGHDTNGTVIASFTAEDQLLPRIAPFTIPCTATASWVKVEASILSPRAFDGRHNLELSEIMVFSGLENVALRKPVTISSEGQNEGGARKREFLVDGFVPYLMDAAHGEQSIAFITSIDPEKDTALTIDLEAPHHIKSIHVHSVDLSDTIPQSTPTDFGLPRHIVIEGSVNADFSESTSLAEYRIQSIFDVAPIIMLNVPETTCRYVRIHTREPYIYQLDNTPGARVGFAEIEIYSNGTQAKNVALNKSFQANYSLHTHPDRSFAALTDGRNLYGSILPIRDWLNELARRHELEVERPLVATELNRRYARQKGLLKLLAWIAGILAVGIGFTILINRILRMRQVSYIRERFAADLHDELGANLHTIGLLSDLTREHCNSPERVTNLAGRIRSVTERTGTAVRHCTDLLEADGLYIGLRSDMERAAERIMAKFNHTMTIEGKEHLDRLNPRTRADLFLFYKECLVNISRHSNATEYSTHLEASPDRILLTVRDNGRGLEEGIPASLKRRARLLKANVSVDSPTEGGTCIQLDLRIRRKQRVKK